MTSLKKYALNYQHWNLSLCELWQKGTFLSVLSQLMVTNYTYIKALFTTREHAYLLYLYFFPIDNPIEVRLDHGLRSSHLRCNSDACRRAVRMVRRYCRHINIVCSKGRQLIDCVRSRLRVQQYRPTRHNLSLCDPLWVHKLFYCIIWYLWS